MDHLRGPCLHGYSVLSPFTNFQSINYLALRISPNFFHRKCGRILACFCCLTLYNTLKVFFKKNVFKNVFITIVKTGIWLCPQLKYKFQQIKAFFWIVLFFPFVEFLMSRTAAKFMAITSCWMSDWISDNQIKKEHDAVAMHFCVRGWIQKIWVPVLILPLSRQWHGEFWITS